MAANDGRVVTNFIHQALTDTPISVYGGGLQTRSFCYVDDLIDGLVKLFLSEEIFTPVNLGNPEPISMLELAKEIIELTDSKSEIVFQDLPQDDPKESRPDITKAQSLLNWSPKVSRLHGLERTLEFIRTKQNQQ
jgi:nucleoside-diphosphate-sugar epimerase